MVLDPGATFSCTVLCGAPPRLNDSVASYSHFSINYDNNRIVFQQEIMTEMQVLSLLSGRRRTTRKGGRVVWG